MSEGEKNRGPISKNDIDDTERKETLSQLENKVATETGIAFGQSSGLKDDLDSQYHGMMSLLS